MELGQAAPEAHILTYKGAKFETHNLYGLAQAATLSFQGYDPEVDSRLFRRIEEHVVYRGQASFGPYAIATLPEQEKGGTGITLVTLQYRDLLIVVDVAIVLPFLKEHLHYDPE